MLSLRVVYWSIYGILGSIIDQFTVLIGHELLHFYVILGARMTRKIVKRSTFFMPLLQTHNMADTAFISRQFSL